MRKINLIVIHCSATPAKMDIGAKEIRAWHTLPEPKGRGWSDIGYHYVIRRDGKLESGRPLAKIGAHVEGKNANSIGICLIGGVESKDGRKVAFNNFTAEQMDELAVLLKSLRRQFPDATMAGHRDVARGKECPSFSVRDYLNQYLNEHKDWK